MGEGSEKGCGCLTAVVFALWIWFTLVLSPDSNSGVRYGAIGEFSYGFAIVTGLILVVILWYMTRKL